jgi:hypothetical protein
MCQSDNCACGQSGCGGHSRNQLPVHDISTSQAVGLNFNSDPPLPSGQEALNNLAMTVIRGLMGKCPGLGDVMAAVNSEVPTFQLLIFLLTPQRDHDGLPPLMWLWAGHGPERVVRCIRDARLVI